MKKAKEFNDKGRFFPILGTSLGMESMVISMTGNNKQVISCNYDDHETNHTIQKTSEFLKSKFWGKIDSDLVDKAFSNGYLYYSHICGFDPIKLANDPAFQKEGIITGTSISKNGKKFVAMVEHKSYPFIALQWHPEKT